MKLFINKERAFKKEKSMPIIKNLNINTFKRNLGGIANRMVDNFVNGVEQKLENAVENAFAKGLKKVGLSNGVASQISARFNDAFSVGKADDFFKSSTAEQNRVSKQDIENNLLAGLSETTLDAVQKINTNDITKSPVMQFPDQRGEYYMVLKFQSYDRPSPQTAAKFKHFRTIILPVPRDLKENFDLNIDGKPQGFGGGVADVATDFLRGAGIDKLKGQAFALAYSKLIQMTGDAGDSLGQIIGAVPNPHLQAIFSGVELRNHTFQWTFAPRNPQESRNLKAIIHEIKKNSLPAYSTTGTAALTYPAMVEISIMPWGDNLIRFKKCLIKNVAVNYAPAGIPSFFREEREPTMIQLELQFLETEIQTAKDYGVAPGERPDNLENLKDLGTEGIAKLEAASGIPFSGAVKEGEKLLNTFQTSFQAAQSAQSRGQ